MANTKTSIEWTDATWNVVTGCSKVSLGCKHCYAERLFPRAYPGRPFTDVRCHHERLEQPLHWKKPRMIFVNSMSDLFHELVPDGFLNQVFAVMARASQHRFQVLTKRPDRMRRYLRAENVADEIYQEAWEDAPGALPSREDWRWPLANVWLGTSVEDQRTANERIPLLLQTPAAIRFVSYEPALAPVNFRRLRINEHAEDGLLKPVNYTTEIDALKGECVTNLGVGYDCPRLDWVLMGAESGPGARPMNEDWVRSVIKQCRATDTAFFYKQKLDERGHKVGLPLLDGQRYVEFPR